jgi:hypothetical protein
LLVLLQADNAVTFSSFVLTGLAGSLKAQSLEDLLANTYYQAALKQIEEWEVGYPETIKRLSEVLENDYGRTLNQLKFDLKSRGVIQLCRCFALLHRKLPVRHFSLPLLSKDHRKLLLM